MSTAHFGFWLQRAMQHVGISSQRELGRLLGKSHTTVGRWMSGEYKPKHRDIAQLASVLNTSRAEVYEALELMPPGAERAPESKKRLINKVLELTDEHSEICEGTVDYLLGRQARLQAQNRSENPGGESSQ